RVGIEPPGHLVHPFAPGPEGTGAGMGTAAQGAVERVGVHVGQAGEGEPGQPRPLGRRVRRDGFDETVPHFDGDVPGGIRTAEPGVLRVVPGHRHANSPSTVARASTPAAQSTSLADSSGAWEIPVGLRTNSIAVGTCPASTPASCPAPVGSTGTPPSSAAIRSRRPAWKSTTGDTDSGVSATAVP